MFHDPFDKKFLCKKKITNADNKNPFKHRCTHTKNPGEEWRTEEEERMKREE